MENYGYNSEDVCGISKNFSNEELQPLNGLRHNDLDGNSGWFMWRGDYSKKDDFFHPIHIEHIEKLIPQGLLELAPGYRFLLDTNTGYKDVWFDKDLLNLPD